MANATHLQMLLQGTAAWNQWREEHASDINAIIADFRGADLRGIDLTHARLGLADFRGCRLDGAKFREAFLLCAKFTDLNLHNVDFSHADLIGANFTGAKIVGGSFAGARFDQTDLTNASLEAVNMIAARMVNTNISGAIFRNCRIWAISVWDLHGEPREQRDFIITPKNEPNITLDNIAIAQFVYLLLNNASLRHIIDTLTTKAVLLLGRFTPDRKFVLDAVREALRQHNYLPIVFDFDRPANRNLTETISMLAHISKFVVADITDPKSVPQELERIVPTLPSVPIVPLLEHGYQPWGMFDDHHDYPWVLNVVHYHNLDDLLNILHDRVIVPARNRAQEIAMARQKRRS